MPSYLPPADATVPLPDQVNIPPQIAPGGTQPPVVTVPPTAKPLTNQSLTAPPQNRVPQQTPIPVNPYSYLPPSDLAVIQSALLVYREQVPTEAPVIGQILKQISPIVEAAKARANPPAMGTPAGVPFAVTPPIPIPPFLPPIASS